MALSMASRSSIDSKLLMPHVIALGIGVEVELATNPENWAWGSTSGNQAEFFSTMYSAIGTHRYSVVARYLGHHTKRRIHVIAYYRDLGLRTYTENEVPVSASAHAPTTWIDAVQIAAAIRSEVSGAVFTAYPKTSIGSV